MARVLRLPSRLRQAARRLRDAAGFHGALGALMAVLFGFHLLLFREVMWWGDSYQYLMHAQNLLAGEPYAATGYVPSPHNFTAPAAYPIGYPLLLVLVTSLVGTAPAAHAAVSSLLLLAMAWVTATFARGWVPDLYAAGLAVLIGIQPSLMHLGWQPRADPLFMLLAMLALLAADRASYRSSRSTRWAGIAGVAVGAAVATRTLGILLFPAILMSAVWRERSVPRHVWVSLGIGLALVGAVSLYDVGEPTAVVRIEAVESPGYAALVQENVLDQLRNIPARIPARAADYLRGAYALWRIPGPGVFKHLLMGLAFVVVAIGFAYRVRRRPGPAEAFAPLYVASLLPWTFYFPRYLYPVYPLYYLYLIVGVWRLGRDRPRQQWILGAVLVALAAGSYSFQFLEWTQRPLDAAVRAPDASMYRYIRDRTPEDALLVTSTDPRISVYHTGRRATRSPNDIETWRAYAEEIGADYALAAVEDAIVPDLQADSTHRLVHAERSLLLFERCPEGCVEAQAEGDPP